MEINEFHYYHHPGGLHLTAIDDGKPWFDVELDELLRKDKQLGEEICKALQRYGEKKKK